MHLPSASPIPGTSAAATIERFPLADDGDLKLVVHRSASEIGGNCIELRTAGTRLLLDIGRPLKAEKNATGLLAPSLNISEDVAGILVSHPHLDHYGLLAEAPEHWPVHCGEATLRLMQLTGSITGHPVVQPVTTWRSGRRFEVGPFAVTPLLTDHSAFDAHMLLIEAAGRRVLYTGDFRRHGRKAALVDRLMKDPPAQVDVLLLEGTNIGSNKPTVEEDAVEDDFVKLMRETPGRVFVTWSAQNVDRTVSLYRACLQTKRTLAVDLYTAEVLETLAGFGRLPRPGWPQLRVVFTKSLARMYRQKGRGEFVERMVQHGIAARKLAQQQPWVVMTRASLIRDYETNGVMPCNEDSWSYSMWRGYLGNEDGQKLTQWFASGGSQARHIHTSGHASQPDLLAFANAVQAKRVVPIHGENWQRNTSGFVSLSHAVDGSVITL